ncbi:MAG: hypothetical protein LIO65_05980 [Odoribacter sp.]|nr:hypothetical protein [Odoribacter sp.]
MLLTGNNTNPLSSAQSIDEAFVLSLIVKQQYAEAYSILSVSEKLNKAGLYNLALCLIYAEQYPLALSKLEELTPVRTTPSFYHPGKEEEVKKSISIKQNRTNSYKSPIDSKYTDKFPDILEESALRLKIDCYLTMGHWNKIIETAPLLRNKNYENVETALQEAQNNLK